jgi:acyl-CoA thioesterase II
MSAPTGFLARVGLEPAGPDRWSAAAGGTERMALGLLGAQAMVAAGRTVDTRWRWVHAVHVTRLDQGVPGTDERIAEPAVLHQVERTYDAGPRSVRLVRSVQRDTPVAVTTVTFAAPQPGRAPSRQRAVAVDDVPPPGALAPAGAGSFLDVRHLDRARCQRPDEPQSPAAPTRMWTRVTEEIPDQILLHAAALTMAADLLLVELPTTEDATQDGTSEWADLEAGRGLRAVPLDLSIRIHRGFRADDWMLHGHESVSAADYRALTTGWFVSPAGRLVATVSSETALLPVPGPRPAAPVTAAYTTP